MMNMKAIGAHHYVTDLKSLSAGGKGRRIDEFKYTFRSFFHPYVGELIQQLNKTSVAGMLDPAFLNGLRNLGLQSKFLSTDYQRSIATGSSFSSVVDVAFSPEGKDIDVSVDGPYANYNWELLFHAPV